LPIVVVAMLMLFFLAYPPIIAVLNKTSSALVVAWEDRFSFFFEVSFFVCGLCSVILYSA